MVFPSVKLIKPCFNSEVKGAIIILYSCSYIGVSAVNQQVNFSFNLFELV